MFYEEEYVGVEFETDEPSHNTDRIRDVHRYGDIEEECNAANLFSMVGKHDGQRVKEDPNGRFHFWKTFAMHILAGCHTLRVITLCIASDLFCCFLTLFLSC